MVTSDVVVGCIFFACDHVVVVVELSKPAPFEFVDGSGVQVEEEGSRSGPPLPILCKEGVIGLMMVLGVSCGGDAVFCGE
jgi:hypothetical protein